MSGLAALLAGHNPPDIYQWHNAAQVDDVQHAVELAGWTFRYLDGWTTEDEHGFLKGLAAALEVPDQSGADLDSLAAELAGVSAGDSNGVVLLWDGWSPLARHDETTFDRAVEILAQRARSEEHGRFAVILRGEGPPLDIAELPLKH